MLGVGRGHCPYIIESLAASWAPTHKMPVIPSPLVVTNKNV